MTPRAGDALAAIRGPHGAASPSNVRIAESIVVGILGIAAVAGPMACGATGTAARLGLEVAMTVAALLWSLSKRRPLRFLLAPLALTAPVLLQLVPLPDRLLGLVAPASLGLWKAARAGLDGGWGTVSVNPSATVVGLTRLLLGLAMVVVVIDLAREPRHRRWLCGAIVAAGSLAWIAGLVFPVDSQQRILLGFIDLKGPIKWWLTPIEPPRSSAGVGELTPVALGSLVYLVDERNIGDGFGPYLYSNHFAGAMCLTLPLLIASWINLTVGRLPNWLRVGVALILAGGGLWTNWSLVGSRAGTLSLAGALVAFAALSVRGRWAGPVTRACAMVFGCGLVLLLGMMHGPLRGLVATLPDRFQRHAATMLADPRVKETEVALRMFASSKVFGTGLGTYDDMNGHLVRGRFISYFAHNDYAQFLGETGLVGALVVLLAVGWAFRAFRRCRLAPLPDDAVLQAGAWAAAVGIGLHSCFDWNLHLPANALLAALVVGLAWSCSQLPVDAEPMASRQATVIVASAFFLACTAALLFLGRDAASDRVERELRTAITADRLAMAGGDRLAAVPGLDAAISYGDAMARWDPGNPEMAMLLGQANLHLAAAKHSTIRIPTVAETWFAQARANAAACRGFPESVARSPLPPVRSSTP